MRCPFCEIVMKDQEVIEPWYVFYECQSCGLILIQITVNITPEGLDRWIAFDQEEFQSLKTALAGYAELHQLDFNPSWEADQQYMRGRCK